MAGVAQSRTALAAFSCAPADYEADGDTGKVIYGYVSDMCPDENWWCQVDDGHLDISRSHLRAQGLLHNWHGREIFWEYVSSTPEQCAPEGLQGAWLSVVCAAFKVPPLCPRAVQCAPWHRALRFTLAPCVASHPCAVSMPASPAG